MRVVSCGPVLVRHLRPGGRAARRRDDGEGAPTAKPQERGTCGRQAVPRGREAAAGAARVAWGPRANAVDLRHSLMRASDVKGCIHEQLNQDMR